jgi:glycosyltransferase involved in cell wall biosynthesis
MLKRAVISVITCAHNSRPEYLTRVFGALKGQSLDSQYWEFLLIDSASTPPLSERVDLSWHTATRYFREEEPGLTRARLRGIAEAKGELLIFVDDDNVLDPDFLAAALQLHAEWPQIGAWSGQCLPEFDVTPPEWTERYWGNLVIRRFDRDRWSNLPLEPETMPCGAGLCVRRAVAKHYWKLHERGARNFLLDRVGTSLISGGDNDLAACACELDLGVGVFTRLRLKHLIPSGRLTEDYLLRLTEGIAFSTTILHWYWRAYQAFPAYTAKTRIADVVRLSLMPSRERRFFRATRRGERRARQFLAQHARTSVPLLDEQEAAVPETVVI